MATIYTKIHEEQWQGFTITAFAAPEDMNPADHFTEDDEFYSDETIIERIRNGTLEWFMVRVSASRNGVHLADDYLGACCYGSVFDFIKCEYYNDMRASVVRDAHAVIAGLSIPEEA